MSVILLDDRCLWVALLLRLLLHHLLPWPAFEDKDGDDGDDNDASDDADGDASSTDEMST